MKKFLSIAICFIMVISLVACKNDPAGSDDSTPAPTEQSTKAPAEQTTGKPDDQTAETPADQTTEAPAEQTTEAPAEQTTEAPVLSPIEFKDLPADQQAALLGVMPATLPDGAAYEITSRTMSFDRGADDYYVEGNSQGGAEFVDVTQGAIFGNALKMKAISDKGDSRAEVQVVPYNDVNISDAKGVMFYVDFSNVAPSDKEGTKMCASVTINTNDYRSKGPNGGNGDRAAVAYYYLAGTWIETSNINACRLEIPEKFAGWIYVPSSTFYGKNENAPLGETFGDLIVMNMRCYTDGYTYSADTYIIFDEIVFVK